MSKPAPQNIYDLCNEVYAHRGQYGVFDFVGQFNNIEWTWCMPCEEVTPFDPYANGFTFDETTETNVKEVICLVCGSSNPYVNYKAITSVVFYEDGTKAVQECKYEEQLKYLQNMVRGYVEAIEIPSLGITMWCNEEAKIKPQGLVPNFNATKLWQSEYGDTDVIYGNAVLTSSTTDVNNMITSLSTELVERLVAL